MIVEKIEAAASKAGVERERLNPVRLSNAGRCARQTAYAWHGIEGEPLAGRSILVFDLGNRIEAMLREWAERGGLELFDAQREVSMALPDAGEEFAWVRGHLDGTVLASDGEKHVFDFKSIATLGFNRVEREGTEYAYRCQMNAYMEATGLRTWAIVVYMDKNTQHLHESIVPYDAGIVDEIRARFLRVVRSTPAELPPREHVAKAEVVRKAATGKWVLPWECAYCQFKKPCWGVGEPDIKSGKPVWYVEPPKVEAVAGGVRW